MFFVPCRVTFRGGPHHRLSADLEYVPDASVVLPTRLLEIEAARPPRQNEQLRRQADQRALTMCNARAEPSTMLALLRSSANTPSRQLRQLPAKSITAVYGLHCCEVIDGDEIELQYHFVAFEPSLRAVRLSLFGRRIPRISRWRQLFDRLIGHPTPHLTGESDLSSNCKVQSRHEPHATQS